MDNDKGKLVLLVDENDNEIGTYDKIMAHEEGKLHRAFSVFIFDPNGRLIIHRRALHKYHSPGLWTNSCCSHPLPNLNIEKSIEVRTMEELGIEIYNLKAVGSILYRAKFENGLIEHEFDHIFVAITDKIEIPFNSDEVDCVEHIELRDILDDMNSSVSLKEYTPWFRIIMSNKEIVDNIVAFKKSCFQNM